MPPVIRLIQADTVDAWQRALLALCLPTASTTTDGQLEAPPTVVVPGRSAAEQWRRTLERRVLVERWRPPVALQRALEHPVAVDAPEALAFPALLARDEAYDAWHRQARIDAPRLSAIGREVLMAASAREAARHHRPPFVLRPGLIAEMVRFFDQAGRLAHDPVEWLVDAALRLGAEADTDRGAARLLGQTQFLRAAFEAYARKVRETGALDEQALRVRLRHATRRWAPRHLVVTVGDHHAEAHGLWPVDFDLLAAADGLARLDIIATARVADGLFARLRRRWSDAVDVRVPPQQPAATALEVTTADRRWMACRDREDEVLAFARRLKSEAPRDASRAAMVVRRPLPYLYAARQIFESAGIPYQSAATLPLAAEPGAASLDLLMDVALSGYTRAALVTLLRSPHVVVRHADGTRVDAVGIAALDRWLAEQRYLGTSEHLDALLAVPQPALEAGSDSSGHRARIWAEVQMARRVAHAVRPLLDALAPLRVDGPGARHVTALRAAWQSCAEPVGDDDPEASRTRRTRASLALVLDELERALAEHDTATVSARDTCILVRRWIEERTFALPRADAGLHLVDAEAAVFGTFDRVRIVGLLEGEWPEPTARNIFYPSFMLERLGWAEERTRTATARARFADLLTLPAVSVGVTVPELDQDAVVRPSSLLDELLALDAQRLLPLPVETLALPVTRDDALLALPVVPTAGVLDDGARDWAAWRLARPEPTEPGQVAASSGGRYAVTAVETYLQCPFQYFASRVLGLREDAEEVTGLPARDAGLLLHDVLHDGFAAWHALGHTAITLEDLPRAREVFDEVARRWLRALPAADRAVEASRLFGSAVATGAIEKVLRLEVELFGDTSRRALEHDIDGTFELPGPDGARAVRLRGRIDRVDWTRDGRIRVIDYKSGRRPTQPLQPGVYAHAIVQDEQRRGRAAEIGASGFIAFREPTPWVASVGDRDDADEQAQTFVEAIDAIEAGRFPVRPHNPFRCQFCHFAGVCRKDYVGDE
ncbi:MAG TPA: PD-(D/E)XK nuclease family protein [Luteitalea sp.]|nr:PD-(D/E)XK nuclease family protein [Luteitalea sp.]